MRMQHFPIIQALCRTALSTGGLSVRRQVERLRDAAQQSDDQSSARSLEQLLSQSARVTEMAPSKLTQSRSAQFFGEELTKNTPLPVDKETASPLADIFFPEDLPLVMPLFDSGLKDAAQTLVKEWSSVQALQDMGVEPARTCLIYGPPGTGKTTLALWLAREIGVPAIVARLDGLISSFLGTTARNVGNLFNFANRYKCILILDEFDAVAKVRDDPHEVGEIKRVVNALLQNIDKRRGVGVSIAITNHETLLDPAIWRRFEIQLKVPKPSLDGRMAIIRLHLPPVEVDVAHEKLMAWLTEGVSGAEVEIFVKGLKKYYAMNDNSQDSFMDILKRLIVLTGARFDESRTGIFELDSQAMAQKMVKEGGLGFTNMEIGKIMNRDKSTISRWVKTV